MFWGNASEEDRTEHTRLSGACVFHRLSAVDIPSSGALPSSSANVADQCPQRDAKDRHIHQHANGLPSFKAVEDDGKLCCLLSASLAQQDGSGSCERDEHMQQEQPRNDSYRDCITYTLTNTTETCYIS